MDTLLVSYNFLFLGTLWSWAVWALFGLIAGAIAKFIMPGDDPGGLLVTMIIGILGAILGGKLSSFIMDNDNKVAFYNPKDWIFSILGALIILFIWKKFIAPMFKK